MAEPTDPEDARAASAESGSEDQHLKLFNAPQPRSGARLPPLGGQPLMPPAVGADQTDLGQPVQGVPVPGESPSIQLSSQQRPPFFGEAPEPVPRESQWGGEALEAERSGGTWIKPPERTGEHLSAPLAGGYGSGTPTGGAQPGGPARRIGPKPIRGPRFSGGPLVAGFGLLSILIVVAIMAFMAVKVLDGTGSGTSGKADSPALPGSIEPGNQTSEEGGLSGTGASEASSAAACGADQRTIATAAAAYSVINGSDPTSIDQLVTADLLKENPKTFTIESGVEGVRVVGIGVCEGTN